jgi:hypothetical protein
MWIVSITKKPARDDFRDNFFPRRVYYRRDAEDLQQEVRAKGGDAIIEKVTDKESV